MVENMCVTKRRETYMTTKSVSEWFLGLSEHTGSLLWVEKNPTVSKKIDLAENQTQIDVTKKHVQIYNHYFYVSSFHLVK